MNKTIVLNMIVKNESQILRRCFDSLVNYIDYYVIVDTGSDDGTQDFIRNYFKEHNIKGELHEEPWVNFGYNRNHALKLAYNKADYIMLTDSDMQLVVYDKDFKSKLNADMCLITQGNQSFVYHNVRIIKSSNEYEYIGVTHEYLDCKKSDHTKENLTGVHFDDHADGKNRADKFIRDINLLEQGIKDLNEEDAILKNENNEKSISKIHFNYQLRMRYKFYLAQSYKDNGNFQKAIELYKDRGNMGGWIEEVFFSFMQVAKCYERLNDWDSALKFYLEAYHRHPTRAESIYEISKYYRVNNKNNLAYLFANAGVKIPFPSSDSLFISKDVYDYQMYYELMICSYYVGQHSRGELACEMLLHKRVCPSNIHDSALHNMIFYAEPIENLTKQAKKTQLHIELTKSNYNICNPTIMLRSDGKYLLNIREVSYYFHIDENYYSYDKTIDTINHICVMDSNDINNIQPNTKLVNTVVDTPNESIIKKYDHYITGFEDFRLVEYNNTIYGICTSMVTNETGYNEMLLCRFDSNFKIDHVVRLKGYEDNLCQKNWIPFVANDSLLILYSNDPTVILRPNLETGYCTVEHKLTPKFDLSRYRGSSQLVSVEFQGTKGYLYIVHQVGHHQMSNGKSRRYYYHRFVFMDSNYVIRNMSRLFYLVEKTIEFVSGMTLDHTGENLLITCGVEDKRAYLLSVPLSNALKSLSLVESMENF